MPSDGQRLISTRSKQTPTTGCFDNPWFCIIPDPLSLYTSIHTSSEAQAHKDIEKPTKILLARPFLLPKRIHHSRHTAASRRPSIDPRRTRVTNSDHPLSSALAFQPLLLLLRFANQWRDKHSSSHLYPPIRITLTHPVIFYHRFHPPLRTLVGVVTLLKSLLLLL